MGPLQSLGPDSLNADFFQSYWHIVGNDVSAIVSKFLNEGQLENGINYTFIVLIPKIKNPLKSSDHRPIRLCNVVYKLVSKVLANRLKKVLPSLFLKIKVFLFQVDLSLTISLLLIRLSTL